MRGMLIVGAVTLGLVGCSARVDAPVAEEAVGGRYCLSSEDCGPSHYCTTEDGDCRAPCRGREPCIAVCAGVCRVDRREVCGDRVCPAGTECCNASCGICVTPGEFCTQQLCGSVEPL